MSRRISIDPITRLEGHGRIEIFLDEQGEVANAYLQVPELRGFEQFCVGRPAEDMPNITSRICGVCPEAHQMAAVKALDQLFGTPPPSVARKLRELLYMAFFVSDHTTHFYALGGPDFIVGPDAGASERNILGVIRKVGLDVGKQVIDCRARNGQVIKTIGGREIHPTAALPGGWSKPLSEDERCQVEEIARKNIDFALFTLQTFDTVVLNNTIYREMIEGDVYLHRTYSMGTVDEQNRLNLYDGKIRVVDPEGREFLKYDSTQYASHIAERVEPWTYMKFPYLREKGWNGFVDGMDSGVYSATPLSRLNVCDGLATPRAQQEYERFYRHFGKKKVDGRYEPVHHRMATHWARLIELLYASEHMLELATDPEITCPGARQDWDHHRCRHWQCGSAAWNVDASLHNRPERNSQWCELDCGDHQQPCGDGDECATRCQGTDSWGRCSGRLVESRRDGVSPLRSVHVVCHALAAGNHAAGVEHSQRASGVAANAAAGWAIIRCLRQV